MDYLSLFAGLGIGAVCALSVWALNLRKLQSIRLRMARQDDELTAARSQLVEMDSLRSRERASHEEMARLGGKLESAEKLATDFDAAQKRIFDLSNEAAGLRANLESAGLAHKAQIAQLTQMRQEVQDQFKLLAGDVLKSSSTEFMTRAQEIFTNQRAMTTKEIDERTKAMSELIAPLGESLKSYDVAIKDIEKARIAGFSTIDAMLQSVNAQHTEVKTVTANLVNALRASPKTRGRWGEETLRRVMELSGMVENCDFETEKHFRGTDESLRPDVLINVSGGRVIVVDAKAPVSAYLDAIAATSEDEREILLKRHAMQLRERLTNLSSKSYWEKIAGSTDCVVMFVPGDNFVSAAFERDPDLFEDGIKNRVLICTPTTFIALTKAISYGWRQEKLAANALDVAKLGKDLYGKLATLGDHICDLGKHINNAAKKYNAMVGSLESSVMPQARRFNELGVEGTSKAIEPLPDVDTVVRFPQAGRDLLLTKSAE
ncbi:MAG: hypothetical protein JWN58_1657 [Gammaproteobacteria bacterium]|nr:hypothetical protein [Gammaproteobacteria bacterium]